MAWAILVESLGCKCEDVKFDSLDFGGGGGGRGGGGGCGFFCSRGFGCSVPAAFVRGPPLPKAAKEPSCKEPIQPQMRNACVKMT